MLIGDGILSGWIVSAGVLGTAIGLAYEFYRLRWEEIPRLAVWGSFFFIISLIFIPLPLVRCRLLFIGAMGVALRKGQFLVITMVFSLQTLFLGYGGVTSLGVNVFIVAAPAIVGCWLFDYALRRGYSPSTVSLTIGMASASLSLCLTIGALIGSDLAYSWACILLGTAYLPIIAIETVVGRSLLRSYGEKNSVL